MFNDKCNQSLIELQLWQRRYLIFFILLLQLQHLSLSLSLFDSITATAAVQLTIRLITM